MMYIMTFSLLNMCFWLEVLVFMCLQGFLGKNSHIIFLFAFMMDGDIHSANFAKVEAMKDLNELHVSSWPHQVIDQLIGISYGTWLTIVPSWSYTMHLQS